VLATGRNDADRWHHGDAECGNPRVRRGSGAGGRRGCRSVGGSRSGAWSDVAGDEPAESRVLARRRRHAAQTPLMTEN